jgi:hypothetical protein
MLNEETFAASTKQGSQYPVIEVPEKLQDRKHLKCKHLMLNPPSKMTDSEFQRIRKLCVRKDGESAGSTTSNSTTAAVEAAPAVGDNKTLKIEESKTQTSKPAAAPQKPIQTTAAPAKSGGASPAPISSSSSRFQSPSYFSSKFPRGDGNQTPAVADLNMRRGSRRFTDSRHHHVQDSIEQQKQKLRSYHPKEYVDGVRRGLFGRDGDETRSLGRKFSSG